VVVGVVAITPKSTVDDRLMPETAEAPEAKAPDALEPVAPPATGDGKTPTDPWPGTTPLPNADAPKVDALHPAANIAPPPAPEQPSFRLVKVQAGDTLALIAKRELGSSARYQEILKINPGLVATKLRKGQEIKIPVAPTTSPAPLDGKTAIVPTPAPLNGGSMEPAPAPSTGEKIYVVKKGDTLSGIAGREMGSKNKWQALQAANADVLHGSTALKIGMKLRIPASESSTTTTSTASDLPAAPATTQPMGSGTK
jgi:nucleoid-associated protein YgaU